MTNKNGWARSTLSHWVYPQLTEAEREELWGDIYRATRRIAPSGIMFASGVRTDGLRLMADNKIEEGLDLAAWYVRWQKGHGNRRRVPSALESILKYGAHAKRVIPQLEAYARWYQGDRKEPEETATKIREAIKKVEAIDAPPEELVSIGKYLDKDDIPGEGP